jgi:hypothetical protein
MIKYLSMLFHSLRYSFARAGPDWIVRLISYWEDFGHDIVWSELEKAYLDAVISRAFAEIRKQEEDRQREKDERRIRNGLDPRPHDPFRPLVQPVVDATLQGCRWNSYGLSLLELKDLVSLAISEIGADR